jgi:hypothetical protein
MKKKLFRFKFLFLIITVFFVISSCVQNKRNLKSETYKAGIEIIDQIISTYRQMSDVSYTSKYNQQLVSILTDIEYINKDGISFVSDAMEKIIAFETLKKVYMKYDLISDKNFTPKTAGIDQAVLSSCDALDSLAVSDEISTQLAIITDYILASSYDENLVLQGLTEQYLIMWQKDVAYWQLLLSKAYTDYSEGIDNIPYEKFDEEKLSKFVYEPYSGKEVMVNIYKLSLKDEAFKDKETISSKLNDLSWGLENINLINSEYSKKVQDAVYIEVTIDKVKAYLLEE